MYAYRILSIYGIAKQFGHTLGQSENLQKARGTTRPGASLSVALLEILRLGNVRTVLQYIAIAYMGPNCQGADAHARHGVEIGMS